MLGGMDSADTHHAMNSFTFDPGGALYVREGIFHRSQIETPWAPTLRQADGGVFRFEPRTFKFETYIPMNFPNPHGHVFDQWGRDIIFDATGGQPYYGPSFSTKKSYPAMESTKAPRPGKVRTRPVGGVGDHLQPSLPRRHAGQPRRAEHDRLPGIAELQGHRGRRRPEDRPKSSRSSSRPTRTSVPSMPRSAPTARSTSRTGRTRSSATCSTTCATPRAITATAASIASPTRVVRCSSRRRSRAQPIPALLDLLKEPENRVRYRAKIELSTRPQDVLAALTDVDGRLDKRGRTTSTR